MAHHLLHACEYPLQPSSCWHYQTVSCKNSACLGSFPYPELLVHVLPPLTLLLGDVSPVNLAHEHGHVTLASMRKPCLGGVTRQAQVHITQPQQQNGAPSECESVLLLPTKARKSALQPALSLSPTARDGCQRRARAGFALAWRQELLHQPVQQHGCCLVFMSDVLLS